jgi:hypothetical protein
MAQIRITEVEGGWRWEYVTGDGITEAASTITYPTAEQAEQAAQRMKGNAAEAQIQDEDGAEILRG